MRKEIQMACAIGLIVLSYAALAIDEVVTEDVDGVRYFYSSNSYGVRIEGLERLATLNSKRLQIPRKLGGKKVRMIGDCAFYNGGSYVLNGGMTLAGRITRTHGDGCLGFDTVILPRGLESIGAKAFYQCADIVEINIPDSVIEIGDNAFEGCQSLRNAILPPQIETIPRGLFEKTKLEAVDIPDGVVKISREAFKDCEYLRTVKIPDSVAKIDSWAFRNCVRLAKPEISVNVSVSKDAFEGCFKGVVGKDNVVFEVEDQGDASVEIKKVKAPASVTSLEIPETINGKTVVGIAENAFSNCSDKQFKIASFPKSLSAVSGRVLRVFKNATIIKLPGLVRVEREAFAHFNTLKMIDISSASQIDREAFYKCTSLTNVVFSSSVTEIPYEAFESCENLGEIKLPGQLKVIGDYAFRGCAKLQIESFPESLKSVGYGAFEGCAKIGRVAFAEGLETLGARAFKACSSLTEVYIPDSVKELPFALFCDCVNLRAVRQPEDIVHGCDVFKGCENLPEECKIDSKERKRREEKIRREEGKQRKEGAQLNDSEKKRLKAEKDMEESISKIDDAIQKANAKIKLINEKVERGEYLQEALKKMQEQGLKGN